MKGLGFKVKGSGFRVRKGLGFRAVGRVYGLGYLHLEQYLKVAARVVCTMSSRVRNMMAIRGRGGHTV